MTDAEDIPTETPHVFIRGEGGSVFKLDLPLHESIEERMAKGYIVQVADAEGNPYVPTSDDPPVAKRPELSARKPVWVGWAVEESARRGNPITPDDAEALTKDDLIERYGTEPITPPVPVDPGWYLDKDGALWSLDAEGWHPHANASEIERAGDEDLTGLAPFEVTSEPEPAA